MKKLFEQATHRIISPGRVNLLGEHVDYCDGPVLPAAIDRFVQIDLAPRDDRLVSIRAQDLDEETCFSLDQLAEKVDADGNPLPSWALYPAGVADVIQRHGLALSGMNAVFTSNIPMGSGLSSSAAVEVGFAVAWEALGEWSLDRMTLAQYCQEAENQYVGVNCGLMDQFACANGVEHHALYFNISALEWKPVPLPADAAIVIADSKVRRSLANSAYNDRRAACESALGLLREVMPEKKALAEITPEEFYAHQDRLPALIAQRAKHVIEECARMREAMEVLEAGNVKRFGELMFAGHASLRDLYEVSVPELDTLVEIAADLPGCYGARLTGAGFGGCTVNLVAADQADAFAAALKAAYDARTDYEADVYVCKASQGTHPAALA
ncbi:MAG: galactokinase [Anaerolineaceae bacterium]|nr:galactokinase [Anaerolineaceae bacterium]